MFGSRTSQQRQYQRESADFKPTGQELYEDQVIKAAPNDNGLLASSPVRRPALGSPPSVQQMTPVVFVCYASANERIVRQQLVPTLKVLSNRQLIKPSLDTDLVPGESWNDTLVQRLSQAQIILLMVSRAFLASDYITHTERPLAMRLMHQRKAVVVPIILSHCSWRVEDFAKLQKLPNDVESISDAPREDAWALVEEELVRVVKNLPRHLADFGPPR